jgi:hypothetical protein
MDASRIVARLDTLSVLYLLSLSPHHKLAWNKGRLIYRGTPLIIDLNNESPLGTVNATGSEYLSAPPPRDQPVLRDEAHITGSTTGGNVSEVTGSVDAR